MSEKSLRPRSTLEEIAIGLRRAVKAIGGSAEKRTNRNIARRAALYLPETEGVLYKILGKMTPEQLLDIGLVGEMPAKNSAVPDTRPSKVEHWNVARSTKRHTHD